MKNTAAIFYYYYQVETTNYYYISENYYYKRQDLPLEKTSPAKGRSQKKQFKHVL